MPQLSDFQQLLQAHFDGPKANDFASFGGVDVALEDVESTPQERVGAPCLLLSFESDVVSRWNGANGNLRDLVARFEAQATGANGALVGAENPTPAQRKIARALQDYISQNALNLHESGYMMPEVRREQGAVNDLVSSARGRILWTYEEESL